jgi:hypothetical protein
MYRGAALILVASSVLALSDPDWAQTSVTPSDRSTNVDEWQVTDLSILDFLKNGYDLISVISPSSHTRIYFLTKPGKIVKCREDAAPIISPPTPGRVGASTPTPQPTSEPIGEVVTAPSEQLGTVTTAPPPLPEQVTPSIPAPDVTGFRTEFECAELLRGASKQ